MILPILSIVLLTLPVTNAQYDSDATPQGFGYLKPNVLYIPDIKQSLSILSILLTLPVTTAQYDSDATPQIFGYLKPPVPYAPNIKQTCFAGLNFRSDCRVCAWGSGQPPHFPEKEMPEGFGVVIEDDSCTEYCEDYGVEPHDCNPPIDPETDQPDKLGLYGDEQRRWKNYRSPNGLKYANCASKCAQMCEADVYCDAYSFRPRRKIPGQEDAQGAHCAMYDLDQPISKDANVVHQSQLDCFRVESVGGNPLNGNGYHWSLSNLVPANGQPMCLECCDNTRTSYHFEETIVQVCNVEGRENSDVPHTMIDFDIPTTGRKVQRANKERMNLFDYQFTFGKRSNSLDETLVSCKLNRYVKTPYLVGYNLTIGVQEYFSAGKWWRGVNWCYAEPIVSTLNYWEMTVKGKFEFLEVITVTNGPDPYNTPEYWVAKTYTDVNMISVGSLIVFIVILFLNFRKQSRGGEVTKGGAIGLARSEAMTLMVTVLSGVVGLGFILTMLGFSFVLAWIPFVAVLVLLCVAGDTAFL
eukprot:g4019.t1